MTDETFEALLGQSPAEYAARGWSLGRIRADLRARGQVLELADECAAHLERADLSWRPMTGAMAAYVPAPMTEVDLDLSMRVRRALRAGMRRSYTEAWRAVTEPVLPELAGALYVEGHAITRDSWPMMMERGWVELNGRIVETMDIESERPVFGLYFPGLRYDAEEAGRLGRELGEVPIGWQLYGWGGYEHPAMLGSALAAWQAIDRMTPGRVDSDLVERYRSHLQWLTGEAEEREAPA